MSDLGATLDAAADFGYFGWKVDIESVVRTDNDYGDDQEEEWTSEFEGLQCRVEEVGDASREFRRKDGTVAVKARYVKFRRYHPDLTTEMRVIIDGEPYDILDVGFDPQRAHSRLIVERVT